MGRRNLSAWEELHRHAPWLYGRLQGYGQVAAKV